MPSTRSAAQGGNTGFDAGKKVKAGKRKLVVEALGLLLAVTLTAASVQARDTAAEVVAKVMAKAPALKKLYIDGACAGQRAAAIEKAHGITVQVVRRPGNRCDWAPVAWGWLTQSRLLATRLAT